MPRGESGSDKTDETENPNRTKSKKYPTLFGLVQNRTEPTKTDIVWFGSRFLILKSNEPMLTSLLILVILSRLTHTYSSHTLMIKLKIKVQHKIPLNLFTFSHHHIISSLTVYFVYTKKEH